ncbi:hypothetical protein WMO28_09690 [Blautia sp. CLA-JM-H16]|uniref:Uncharacterized protein n=1 Tax=Blautia aquisgranensis TaxID=3133153 RepID=A0ABV1BHN7_9FIRM
MKLKTFKVLGFLLLVLAVFAVGGKKVSAGAEDGDIQYTIGVVVYNQDSPEMNMFMNYYRDYIQQGFPVKFYFSGSISSADDEIAFIRAMKLQGVKGIISFYGQDIQKIVEACDEEEMYYVLGSGSISDEDYEKVKNSFYFLGSVGPDAKADYEAGYNMADYFADADTSSYIVLTGGASVGNYMHLQRSIGVLEGLAEKEGLSYSEDVEKLAASEETTVVDSGKDDISITICPGYMTTPKGINNLKHAFVDGNYDAVLCTFNVDEIMKTITSKEEEQNSNIKVGTVDCFSQENHDAVNSEDSFENPKIDYVAGKYASMGGPAFAILYNAMSGYPEANTDDADSNTVRLYQGFWSASDKDTFNELYGYTQDIYENAYSCADLMEVIKAYTTDTTPDKLKVLTEAYKVEDVEKRITEN